MSQQVCKIFSRESEAKTDGFGHPKIEAYQEEGSIYHIRRDFLQHPYKSIKICWLIQEFGTNDWIYQYDQVENGTR
jgi:hypothetical protein